MQKYAKINRARASYDLAIKEHELGERYIILDGKVRCLAEMTASDYQRLASISLHGHSADLPLAWDTLTKWYIISDLLSNPDIKHKPTIYASYEAAVAALRTVA